MNEHDKAIAETVASLIASFLEMRKRGVNVKLNLPDGMRLQGSYDRTNWADVGEDYAFLDHVTYTRVVGSYASAAKEATITAQFLNKEDA